jgi:hypothetical protein
MLAASYQIPSPPPSNSVKDGIRSLPAFLAGSGREDQAVIQTARRRALG